MRTEDNIFRVTNYDNLKDLSLFVEEHERATKIVESIDRLYASFLKSKLISATELYKWSGNVLVKDTSDLVGIPYRRQCSKVWYDNPTLASIADRIGETVMTSPEALEGCLEDIGGEEVEFSISDFKYLKENYYYKGMVRGKTQRAYMLPSTPLIIVEVKLDIPIVRGYNWNMKSCYAPNALSSFVFNMLSTSVEKMFNPNFKDMGCGAPGDRAFDSIANREEIYRSKILQKRFKTIISERFSSRKEWLKNTMFFEDPSGKLILFDSIKDISTFKFSIRDHEGKKILLVSRKSNVNEGIAFNIENGNLIGYLIL